MTEQAAQDLEEAKKAAREQKVHHLDLATQPAKRLRLMLAAGEDIREVQRALDKTEDNVVSEVLRNQGTFYEWNHYPKGDVYDRETHSQYFYHAHPGKLRDAEHGHFHTFIRAKGLPRGMKPVSHPDRSQWPMGKDAICHIVGMSMDTRGQPLRLFATNRWVTGETWFKAADVCKLIESFVIGHAQPSWPTNRWVGAMVRLFWPQIIMLVKARDAVIADWQKQFPDIDPLEDRRLEVAAQTDVSIEGQIKAVEASLAAKEAKASA